MRTVEWDDLRQELRLIDQRLLPAELVYVTCARPEDVAWAIREMVVRGAPAIGAAAAFGLALSALRSKARRPEALLADQQNAAQILRQARPTAINLDWAVRRVLAAADTASNRLEIGKTLASKVETIRIAVLSEALRIAEDDIRTNQEMALFGASLIDDGDTIIHHCNTGSLAGVDWGTALGAIRMAHEQGKQVHVLVDETRPRLQGSRLTAWELDQYGIPYHIITDSSAGYFLASGEVQKVLFGADRAAANGDVANKIGTYMLALAAHANRVPVYAVLPTSTIDLTAPDGAAIPIEQRDPLEVLSLSYQGQPAAPSGARALNPAFDITPHRLLTAIVTEYGVILPPYVRNLRRAVFEKLK